MASDSLRLLNNYASTPEYVSGFERASFGNLRQFNAFEVRDLRSSSLFNPHQNPAYQPYLSNNQLLSVELLSCSKGQFTWVDAEGGHFLTSFMDALEEALKSTEEASWEKIAATTVFKMKNRVEPITYMLLLKEEISILISKFPRQKCM